MSIRTADKDQNLLIDVILEACKKPVTYRDENNKEFTNLELDAKSVWYKTHIINANSFGRYTRTKEFFFNLGRRAIRHMTIYRARDMQEQINQICSGMDYSIDAKSSESVRDSNNIQSTLLDKINKSIVEKRYSMADNMPKSAAASFLGKDMEKDR
jgi:hypothetical protein